MGTLAKKLVKPWIIMPLVALLAFGGWWIWFRPDDGNAASAAPSDQVVTATKGPMARTVSAEGTIAAAQTDDLSFTSAGTVNAVNVKAGQAVAKGQVLATIDSAALQASVADAESNVADAQAKLSDDRDADASDAQIAADESSLASAQDGLESAQTDLAGAQLVATFDGTVAAVNISVGEQLGSTGSGGTGQTGSDSGSGRSASSLGNGNGDRGAGTDPAAASDTGQDSSTPDIQVVSTSSFTVDLGFDDTDIGNIKIGQAATVTLSTSSSNANGRGPGGFRAFFEGGGTGRAPQFDGQNGNGQGGTGTPARTDVAGASGKVTDVGTIADASSGVASYPVTVTFTDTSGDYHPGANATVEITYAEVPDAIQVPSLAVTTDNGTSTVTVSANGKEETRVVTTGLTSGGMVQITSGLRAGEQVVVQLPDFGGLRTRAGQNEGQGRDQVQGPGANGGGK